MTQEQTRRTREALAETERLLAKELRYAPDLRKPELLASYKAHIARLQLMLAACDRLVIVSVP